MMTPKQRKLLSDLMFYPLPIFKLVRSGETELKPYVTLETAEYLREIAKEVLDIESKRKPKRKK